MSQALFHGVFVGFFALFAVIRVYFQWRARLVQGPVEYKEGRLNTGLRAIIGAIFFLGVLSYIVRLQLLARAELPLPQWLQWLGGISLPLLAWTQFALGSNFSPTLHVRQEHTLVTSGPYRYVRHPMYSALFLSLLAILLLTRNWVVGDIPLVGLCVIVLIRIQREEQAMIEKLRRHVSRVYETHCTISAAGSTLKRRDAQRPMTPRVKTQIKMQTSQDAGR